jgi:hypothetical protein
MKGNGDLEPWKMLMNFPPPEYPFNFNHLNRGRLLLEAICTLCLLALFSVFIFQKQLQQQRQLEEVNTADAIRAIQKGMKRYVENHWQALVKGGLIDGTSVEAPPENDDPASPWVRTWTVAIDDAELARYLPQGFTSTGEFNQAFRVAIRRRHYKTSRQPVQVVVVSGDQNQRGTRFDDLAGNRIAAMVGSGGGYIPKDEFAASRGLSAGSAQGSLGLWSLDLNKNYGLNAEDLTPVRIVSTADFALEEVESPLWQGALFRELNDRFPNGNTMLTDIDMSGDADSRLAQGLAAGRPGFGLVNLGSLKYKVPDGAGGWKTENGFLIDAQKGQISFAPNPGSFSLDASNETMFLGKISLDKGNIATGKGDITTFQGNVGTNKGNIRTDEGDIRTDFGNLYTGRAGGLYIRDAANATSPTNILPTAAQFGGKINANGNIVSTTGTVRAAKVATIGTFCNAGEIASSSDGSTLACVKNKWNYLDNKPEGTCGFVLPNGGYTNTVIIGSYAIYGWTGHFRGIGGGTVGNLR